MGTVLDYVSETLKPKTPMKSADEGYSGRAYYEIGLDEKNRVASYKWALSKKNTMTVVGSPTDIDSNYIISQDPTTGLITYEVDLENEITVLMNINVPRYIDVPYDPYPAYQYHYKKPIPNKDKTKIERWDDVYVEFNFVQKVGENTIKQCRETFKYLPRKEFEIFVIESIHEGSGRKEYRQMNPKDIHKNIGFHEFIFSDLANFLLGSNFIGLYNEANSIIVKENSITDVFKWENAKYRSYSLKDSEAEIRLIEEQMIANPWMAEELKNELKLKSYSERIKKLPKFKNDEMNALRLIGFMAHLNDKDWISLEALLKVHENLPKEVYEA